MVPLEQEHITAVRRGRSFHKHPRFPYRFGRAIQPDDFHLRRRVIVKKLLILGVLQEILKRRTGSHSPKILLNHGSRRHFASHRRRTSLRRNRSAYQALTIAQPLTRRPKYSIERNSRQTPSLRRRHIHNP